MNTLSLQLSHYFGRLCCKFNYDQDMELEYASFPVLVSLLLSSMHSILFQLQYLCEGSEAVLKRLYNKMLKNPTTIGEPSEIGKRDAIIEIRHKCFWVSCTNHIFWVSFCLCVMIFRFSCRSHYARMQKSSPCRVANSC